MKNPFMADDPETFLHVTLDMAACDLVTQSHMRQNKFADMATHFLVAIVSEMTAAKYPPEAIKATLESVKKSIEAQLAKGVQL
jgi:hypothetical protein